MSRIITSIVALITILVVANPAAAATGFAWWSGNAAVADAPSTDAYAAQAGDVVDSNRRVEFYIESTRGNMWGDSIGDLTETTMSGEQLVDALINQFGMIPTLVQIEATGASSTLAAHQLRKALALLGVIIVGGDFSSEEADLTIRMSDDLESSATVKPMYMEVQGADGSVMTLNAVLRDAAEFG